MIDSVIYNSSISVSTGQAKYGTRPSALAFHNPAPQEYYELACYETNVSLKRHVVNGRSKAHSWNGVRRSAIKNFSDKSRLKLLFTLQNMPWLTHHLTFTYPDVFPTNGLIVQQHVTRLREALCDAGLSGIWVKEFQDRGAPHLHVATVGECDVTWLRLKWSEIIGSCDPEHRRHGVHIEPINNIMKTANYLAKQDSKAVPDGFDNVGRYWAVFGKIRPKPLMVLQGAECEVVPTFDEFLAVENMRRAAHGYPARERRHSYGYTSWGSAQALKDILRRLALRTRLASQRRSAAPSSVQITGLPILGRIRQMRMDYMARMRNTWHKWRSHHLPC